MKIIGVGHSKTFIDITIFLYRKFLLAVPDISSGRFEIHDCRRKNQIFIG